MSDYVRMYRGFKISVSCVELSRERYAIEWAVTPDTNETRDQMKYERIHIDTREERSGHQEEVLGHALGLAESFIDGVISRGHDGNR
ncbi:hypothetical protein AYM40_36780 (plasmid) [Paraburkholderia phytofirmans OLGA172]|jgi:hypothetical protein|uniref:Uncharacterized protein n=1 Tax=Paraburkholderia phytofirmans OLGA172 TaxID=1417228 RepID=A0A160FWV7_9BURK|nr:hypothetical protein [Paraburkholderia phytofirmans]ANB77900.1 hypothetical protein AYM40_36780 [Paraburkholderia phytofirmans OLGA172]